MAWGNQGASASSWVGGNAIANRWQPESELGHTPSAASRMNRVIPQQPYPFRQPQSTFAFTVQSEFPLFIASGNFAVITSGFTQGGF